jgi:hypothetical protein
MVEAMIAPPYSEAMHKEIGNGIGYGIGSGSGFRLRAPRFAVTSRLWLAASPDGLRRHKSP